MKRALMLAVTFSFLSAASVQAQDKPAAEKPAKPDCTAQKTAVDEAVAASKVKPDLTSCKEMKGKEKTDCEKPIKDKAKEDAKMAKEKVTEAKKALACCNNPKKKGCEEAAAAPAPTP
jgi:hypothetical protein